MIVTVVDDRLSALVDPNAQAELVTTGFRFTEGPLWDAREQCLLFCEPRVHKISRWSAKDGLTSFRENANSPTGLTFDPQGRLVTCEPRTSRDGTAPGRRVSRTNLDGTIESLATHYQGGRLSGPNDLICLANGDVIFTDPDGALHHGDGTVTPRETPANGVYRVSGADGSLEMITGGIEGPNGLVMRDGAAELLVADRGVIRSLDMKTRAIRAFVEVEHGDIKGGADGMKLDALGNLYIGSGRTGVWIYSPQGDLLGILGIEEGATNLCWGDADWRSLYVLAPTSVLRIRMKVAGQQLNPR